jgi:uncharacterized protein YuzE
MEISYDPEVDALSISWGTGPVAESDEVEPDVILDYDADGVVIGIEILDASKRIKYLTPELEPAGLLQPLASANAA